MKTYDIFKEYIWLIQTIHHYKKISLENINKLWRETDMSGGIEFSRTTFNRHKDAIEDIFGLFIECDRKDSYQYYIGNSRALEEDTIQNWLLSTLSVNNIISEGLSVQNRIQIESIPNDRFLQEMITAMKKNRKVEIIYRRFGADEAKKHIFCPYALKVYDKRWYVLAFFEAYTKDNGEKRDGYFAVFSLDRVERLAILRDKFKIEPSFNVQEFYRNCYGIVHNDKTPTETVILRAYGREAFNMRSLPLHHSQHEINTTYDYSDFQLHIKPTLDFAGKLLSRGEWIEVLQPEWLQQQIVEMHQKAIQRYQRQ